IHHRPATPLLPLSLHDALPICSMLLPRKRTLLLDRLIPVELSKSCTSTSLPLTSSTLQRLVSPSASSISPSSSYVTPSTPRTSISGPAISCMVLYSFGI